MRSTLLWVAAIVAVGVTTMSGIVAGHRGPTPRPACLPASRALLARLPVGTTLDAALAAVRAEHVAPEVTPAARQPGAATAVARLRHPTGWFELVHVQDVLTLDFDGRGVLTTSSCKVMVTDS
jgi:hypothetical protein